MDFIIIIIIIQPGFYSIKEKAKGSSEDRKAVDELYEEVVELMKKIWLRN